ncbi:putative methyltransferase [Nemania sp. FL0916]|nr:putative methyltransferase [Nemania sp. FL0916]
MSPQITAGDPAFNSIRYLPTNEAYDKWAKVYDSDGNFLQALDDIELGTLFPRFVASIKTPQPWRLVDLGCGTGRNTAHLLSLADNDETEIVALDASQGMLDVARTRLSALTNNTTNLRLEIFDMLTPTPSTTDKTPTSVAPNSVDGLISTLVIEHVPLATFFAHVGRLLRPGGVLLLTNMHADMGAVSQAGFVDPETREKIRPTSYAHTVADVVREARKCGLEVEVEDDGDDEQGVGVGITERAVSEDMVEMLGLRSKKWVGVTCWFGGIFRKVDVHLSG